MIQVNVRDARGRFAELLSAAEAGQTVEVTRDGKAVAHIVPPPARAAATAQTGLPDLTAFRASLGKPRRKSKATIETLRAQDRF